MNYSHLRLRLPNHIKEWVLESSRKNRRSQNAEIIFLLEQIISQQAGKSKMSGKSLATRPDIPISNMRY